jgi:hypothetical protein
MMMVELRKEHLKLTLGRNLGLTGRIAVLEGKTLTG